MTQTQTFQQEIGQDIRPISISRKGERFAGTMTQAALKLGDVMNDRDLLAKALAIKAQDILLQPAPRVADTGAGHLMVRAKSREAVDQAKPSALELVAILRSVGVEGCYVYEFDESSNRRAYARFFNPTVGLWEDSATGTAAGPLCAYLASESLLGAGNDLIVEQGTVMGRRSYLNVTMSPNAELSGSGVVAVRGRLSI